MFSIAAINDTDSRGEWEPLAPTKEAQVFHLSQKYHEGLMKLQCKDYAKSRELLEAVLHDPLLSGSQLDSRATDGHLLQLRFLALKNLATVFLEQGSSYHENALSCYLQAVEIDSKDSSIWNQLGTLSCSMGLLSTSRWAFEQGISCSPNNWNCMEKLLEVLIAIGDEIACLSIADLLLRHWPRHSRALHVKQTIKDGELKPFSPRGIDKLEPGHARLKFSNKRKAVAKLDEVKPTKKVNQNMKVCLSAVTWNALAEEVLGILSIVNRKGGQETQNNTHIVNVNEVSNTSNTESEPEKYGEIRLLTQFKITITLPLGPGPANNSTDISEAAISKQHLAFDMGKSSSVDDEHHQERRSTRLERLRSRKPTKEEHENSSSKHMAKSVFQCLEPFILSGRRKNDDISDGVSKCPEIPVYSSSHEHDDIMKFLNVASENFGAYHLGHLLLEEVARIEINYQESHVKFLELDKLTRQWPQDRTPLCSLFLAELYYDSGLDAANDTKRSELFEEASYHLCKVIEWAAFHSSGGPVNALGFFDSETYVSSKIYPFLFGTDEKRRNASICAPSSDEDNSLVQKFGDQNLVLGNIAAFWIRFSWLSASLSAIFGDTSKAIKSFSFCSSILINQSKISDLSCCIYLSHCKLIRWLNSDRVACQINLLQIQTSLKKATDLMDKKLYKDCIALLSPVLHLRDDIYTEIFSGALIEDRHALNELEALDILLSACERALPVDIEVYLNSHRRKLLLLTMAAGMNDLPDGCTAKNLLRKPSPSDLEQWECVQLKWKFRVAQEVKEICHCASLVKELIDQDSLSHWHVALTCIIGDIQCTLLKVMYSFGKVILGLKIPGSSNTDLSNQMESQCLVDSAIAFCKLQHLDPAVPIKTQVDLIAAIHELLAEFGLCCAGKDNEGKEGMFLKLAIKHLLALDVKLKSSSHLTSEKLGVKQAEGHDTDQEKMFLDQKTSFPSLNINSNRKGNNYSLPTSANEELASGLSPVFETEGNYEKVLESVGDVMDQIPSREENASKDISDGNNVVVEDEREGVEVGIDNALDQSFFCLYGLDLRSSQDSSCEDDLAMHKNTSSGDYQTKEQCADVFQYILPYAKVSSRSGMVKLRRVLRAIRKHFPRPLDEILQRNPIDKFLDNSSLSEETLFELAGIDEDCDAIMNILYSSESNETLKTLSLLTSGQYSDVYSNLYYYTALAEEISATDKFPGFVLNKDGEEFVEQNANLLIYDLLYNPLRFESWQKLANIYDEEVDLLLNDGSKHITITDWQKNSSLLGRVERGRRRSRRCLLMSLALARTLVEKSQIHELLGLVYYDSIQNVVPFYDQRTVVPKKDEAWLSFCKNSFRNFEKAFALKPDWLHAFYLGKLCEKLSYPPEKAFSYYKAAIELNPTAVDPFYRMHASRLKLLGSCGMQNVDALNIIYLHSFHLSTKEAVSTFLNPAEENPQQFVDAENGSSDDCMKKKMSAESNFNKTWCFLYDDCISALGMCTDGELKHYHKARHTIAQGFQKRHGHENLERAKEELSFCFRSSRSSFTINMWEIDSTAKKAKRKTLSHGGNKRSLEVNLPESSRKFITCIRKYILLYLKILEDLKDLCMLERAYLYLRADRRFLLCIGDIIPLALGRYIKVLTLSILDAKVFRLSEAPNSLENLLEKMFHILMDHMNSWGDITAFPEIKCPEISETALYGFIHQFIHSLESEARLDALEGINEKLRKRFKNPKLASPDCAKICKHASLAWCRSIIVKLATITPVTDSRTMGSSSDSVENGLLLFVDLQQNELYSFMVDDMHKIELERKWCNVLSKIKNLRIQQAFETNIEIALSLLKSTYSFYRETSCGAFPSGISLYTKVSSHPVHEESRHLGVCGLDVLDLSIPRKLLLWAYTLLHGYYSNISSVIKYCEENAKLKMKRGVTAASSSAGQTNLVKENIIHDEKVGNYDISSTPLGLSTSVSNEILTHGSEIQRIGIKATSTAEGGERR